MIQNYMTRRVWTILSVLLLLSALFVSCTKERPLSTPEELSYPVTFALRTGLRAMESEDATTGEARDFEKKIESLYVVVFKDSKIHKVFSTASKKPLRLNDDLTKGSFDMGEEGTFSVELLANAPSDLTEKLTIGLDHDAFKKLVTAKPLPMHGEGGFLMTSTEAVSVTTSAGNAADAGTIKLRRLLARIDVLVNVEQLEMTKITIVKAQTKSLLFTGDKAPEDGAKDVSFEPKYPEWFTSKEAKAGLYTYESPVAGETKIRIEASYNGKPWIKEIELYDKDGKPLPVKRNHLYRITITQSESKELKEPFEYRCEVSDWSEGDEIATGDAEIDDCLTVDDYDYVPEIEYRSIYLSGGKVRLLLKRRPKSAADGSKDELVDPHRVKISVKDADKGKVTIDMNTGEVQVKEGTTGTITFDIEEMGSNHQVQEKYKRLKEAKDKTSQYQITLDMTARTFDKDPILDRVAEHNIKSDGSMEASHSIATSTNDKSLLMTWEEAMEIQTKVTDHHLPTLEEWRSIVPSKTCVLFNQSDGGTTPSYFRGRMSTEEESERNPVAVPDGDKTELLTAPVSQWIYYDNVSYALRFIGTKYESAWRYEWVKKSADRYEMHISSIRVPSEMKLTVREVVKDARRLFKESNVTARVFAACGCSYGNIGQSGYYWSATSTKYYGPSYMELGSSWAQITSTQGTSSFAVRLFRGKASNLLQRDQILMGVGKHDLKPDGSWDTSNTAATSPTDNALTVSAAKVEDLMTKKDDYHTPSMAEWRALFSDEGAVKFTEAKGTTAPASLSQRSSVLTSSEVVKVPVSDGAPKELTGVKSQYYYDGTIVYAIRFLDTEYESAWRYEYVAPEGSKAPLLRITAVGAKGNQWTAADVAKRASEIFDSRMATERLFRLSSQSTPAKIEGYWWSADAGTSGKKKVVQITSSGISMTERGGETDLSFLRPFIGKH